MSRVPLQAEQLTMLMTLRMHALDAASSAPILGDAFAADVLDRVEAELTDTTGVAANAPAICTRAAVIDEIARGFLDEHPDAVVVHLGCGLDTRVRRLDPGPGVSWFEVDQEPVIALRRELYEERPGVTTLATSVTEPGWWAPLPADRPRLVLAEGLCMYLDAAGVRSAVTGAVAPDRPTTLVADTVAAWMGPVSWWQPAMRAAGTGFRSSTRDLDAAVGTLRLVDEVSVLAETGRRIGGLTGLVTPLVAAVPPWRDALVLRTYRS